jgi:glycerol kinase
MQFQADILGRSLVRPAVTETTALGAGLLAGLATGVWRSPSEVAGLRKIDRVFRPSITSRQRARLLAGWHDAVSRVTRASQD